jgi:hypothetical protein
MDANTELNEAVDRRIKRETAFKEEIIAQIEAIIASLELCDPTNAASTLDLSQEQLRQVIEKLDNMENISANESARIANTLKNRNLRRAPESTPAAPIAPAVAPPGPPGPPNARPGILQRTTNLSKNIAGTVGNALNSYANPDTSNIATDANTVTPQLTPGRRPAPGAGTPRIGGKRRTKRRRR